MKKDIALIEKKKTRLWGLWTIIDDKESAFQAAKKGGVLCLYLAFCYSIDFVFLHFTGSTILGGPVNDISEYYSTSSIELIAIGVFVWLGIRITINRKIGMVPWVCAWTWFEILLKSYMVPGKGLVVSIIVFIVSVNAWCGWLNYRKYY